MSHIGNPTWRSRLWFGYTTAMVVWAILAYMLLGELMGKGELFALKIDNRPYVSDFVNVYAAGTLARQSLSEHVDIYDRTVQETLQRKLVAPTVPEQTFYNQYPPTMFVTFLPLSFFDLNGAWIVWCVFSVLVFAAILHFTVLPSFSGTFTKFTAAAAFMSAFPTWISFRLGQTSLLMFPAIALFWWLLKKRRPVWAGLASSLLLVKLQYLPMTAAVGAAIGGIPFCLSFAGFCAVWLIISTLIVGLPNMLAWPHALLGHESAAGVSGVSPEAMQNLRGELALVAGDTTLVHIICAVICLAAAAAMFVVWLRARNHEGRRFDTLAGLTTLIMLITSLHTHRQDYIVALLPCAWLYLFAHENAGKLVSSKLANFLKFLAVGFVTYSWVFFVGDFLFHLVKIQPFLLWAVICAVYFGIGYSRLGSSKHLGTLQT